MTTTLSGRRESLTNGADRVPKCPVEFTVATTAHPVVRHRAGVQAGPGSLVVHRLMHISSGEPSSNRQGSYRRVERGRVDVATGSFTVHRGDVCMTRLYVWARRIVDRVQARTIPESDVAFVKIRTIPGVPPCLPMHVAQSSPDDS